MDSDSVQEPTKKAKLDLSKYRSPELVDQVVELISIPKAVFKIFSFAVMGALICAIFTLLLFFKSETPVWLWGIFILFSMLCGLLCGTSLAFTWLLQGAMSNLEGVLTIVLNTTHLAAKDYGDLQTGEAELPSAGELVQQSYDEILVPTLETATKKAFGFLSRPMLWVYRRSIGAMVKGVIKRVNSGENSSEEGKPSEEKTSTEQKSSGSFLEGTEKYSTRVESFTLRARETIESIGGKLRWIALLPLYAVFFVLSGMTVLILIVLRICCG